MTEELTTLADGSIQIILRSEHRSEIATAMIRHNLRAEHNVSLISWIGPLQTKSKTWTAVGRHRSTQKPIAIECGDEHGEFEIENSPEKDQS